MIRFWAQVPALWNGMAYVCAGAGKVCGTKGKAEQALVLANDGDEVSPIAPFHSRASLPSRSWAEQALMLANDEDKASFFLPPRLLGLSFPPGSTLF
jgi:hypothetical protein